MRKIIRLVPLLILPTFNKRKIWMNNQQQEEKISLQQELSDKQIGKNVIHPHIQQQQAPLKEQQKQKDQQQPKIQQSEPLRQPMPLEDNNAALQPNNNAKVQELIEVQQQKIEQAHQIILNQNQAVINDKCPPHILEFLRKTNYKIHHSSQSNSDLTIKNSKGDTFTLDMNQITQQKKDELQLVNNFINPPQQISTIQQAKELLTLQQKDSFYIVSYLPKPEDYLQQIQSKSIFDKYTLSRKVNIIQLQNKFTSLAYNSSSNKNTYLVVRNKAVADYLRINRFHIGVPYIINKTSKQNGNESNNQWEGNRYNMVNLYKQWNNQIDQQVINKTTHLYINTINSQAEAYNKIRQMQMAGDTRKVLLVYTNQRQEFQNQMEDILQKVARTEKNNVVIIKAQHQQLLKNIFKVQPQPYTTIRLFDFNKYQTPLFASNKSSSNYSRYKYKGPFKYQNLCNFVKDNSLPQYYQNKKNLTFIKTVSPNELKKLDNTLVLLQKEGCQSCNYVQGSLDELKRVQKILKSGNPQWKQNLIYKYNIEDPKSLLPLKIRRFSIFNQSLEFTPPTATPRLYIFSQGKFVDLNVGQSLEKLKTIKQSQINGINDFILKDIIDKIRKSENLAFSDI